MSDDRPRLRAVRPPSDFDRLCAAIDYPMFIVTAASRTEISGCLVGFATQASIGPPRLLVMISKANHTYRVAEQSTSVAVHYLSTDNTDLATLFGEQTGDSIDKFERCTWTSGPGGVPIIDDVRGWVAGRVLARVDAGDHVAMFIDITESRINHEHASALTFQAVKDMRPGHPA